MQPTLKLKSRATKQTPPKHIHIGPENLTILIIFKEWCSGTNKWLWWGWAEKHGSYSSLLCDACLFRTWGTIVKPYCCCPLFIDLTPVEFWTWDCDIMHYICPSLLFLYSGKQTAELPGPKCCTHPWLPSFIFHPLKNACLQLQVTCSAFLNDHTYFHPGLCSIPSHLERKGVLLAGLPSSSLDLQTHCFYTLHARLFLLQ